MIYKPLNKVKIYDGFMPELPNFGGDSEELQRTKKWHKDRAKSFTGSKICDLMSCDRSASKMPWGNKQKLLSFGVKAIKYIYSRAKERQTGKIIREADNKNFKFGRIVEPIIKELFKEKTGYNIEEVPFIKYNDYLGSSPDGQIIDDQSIYGFECKASMNWDTCYERIELDMNQSHKDFWQLQTEMLSLKCNKLFYVTSLPPEDVMEVFRNQDDIEYLRTLITDIDIIEVESSPVHQQAIIERVDISNAIIERYIDGEKFPDAIKYVCANYKF